MVTKTPKVIGQSYEGRNIYLYEYFVSNPKLNVLLTGATHGIEAESGDSVVRLLEDVETNPSFYNDINIVAVPYWNVDGIENGTYANAQNYAIGYSILNGATPEMTALWSYIANNKYYPDFYIDNHNLDRWNRGRGNYLYNHSPRLALNENLVIAHTSLSCLYRHKITWNQWTDIVNYVSTNGQGLIYGKYWETDDNGNTNYIGAYDLGYIDGYLSARFDCLSLLIEGVVPADQAVSNPEWEQTKQAQFLANKYMIDWARKHPEVCGSKSVSPYVGEKLPVLTDRTKDELFPERHKVEVDSTGAVTYFWALSTEAKNLTQTKPIHFTTAPLAYAVHNTDEEDLNTYLKDWFLFWYSQGLAGDSYTVEQFHCTAADPWDDAEGDITGQWAQLNVDGYYLTTTRTNFSNYTIYPVDQRSGGGLALIHTLEPMAYGNISRYQGLFPTLRLVANDDYPVLRLIRKLA